MCATPCTIAACRVIAMLVNAYDIVCIQCGGRARPRSRARSTWRWPTAIAADVQAGRLTAGDRLPPQRDLADALGVTVTTVTRGYAEAERRGLVRGEIGRGHLRPAAGLRGPQMQAAGSSIWGPTRCCRRRTPASSPSAGGARLAHRRRSSCSTTSRTRAGPSTAPSPPRSCGACSVPADAGQHHPHVGRAARDGRRARDAHRAGRHRCCASRSPTPACGRSPITCTCGCRRWRWMPRACCRTRSRTPRSSPAAACSTACRRSRTRPAA